MPYSLRDGSKLVLLKAKSWLFDINLLRFRGSLLWNNLPVALKNCQSLNEFKQELKNMGNIYGAFYNYSATLLILLVCKFLWVSIEFWIRVPHLHV